MTSLAVYEVDSSGGYEFCISENGGQALDAYLKMDGRSLLADWLPYRVRMIRKERGRKLLPSDAPTSGPDLILTDNAVAALQPS